MCLYKNGDDFPGIIAALGGLPQCFRYIGYEGKESGMFYKKLCAGMLLCCLVASGCGKGSDNSGESESVQFFVTTEGSTEDIQTSSAEESMEGSSQEDTSSGAEAESVSGGSAESGESTSADTDGSTPTQEENDRSELFEFRVTIGQTEYTLPEDFKTFSKMEWNYDGNKDLELNPHEFISDEAIYKGNHLVYVSFVNLGYDKVTIENCKIGSILFDQIALKDANTNIVLAGEIK